MASDALIVYNLLKSRAETQTENLNISCPSRTSDHYHIQGIKALSDVLQVQSGGLQPQIPQQEGAAGPRQDAQLEPALRLVSAKESLATAVWLIALRGKA